MNHLEGGGVLGGWGVLGCGVVVARGPYKVHRGKKLEAMMERG